MQVHWPDSAEYMWYAWAYEGIFKATGASKLMKLNMPAKNQLPSYP
jgi:hypothetical protein